MKCSEWSITNRRLNGKPWSFKGYPFLLPLHDTEHENTVVVKGAQVGVTETAMNRVFHAMIQKLRNVFYLMPTTTDAGDFSASRFNPAIRDSELLANSFTNVDNVGHKQAGMVNLYVRGSNSRSRLKSVPVDEVVIDELDEVNQPNIPLVRKRKSGSNNKREMDMSTPTIPNFGIMVQIADSDEHNWYARCVHCNAAQILTFEDNIEFQGGQAKTARFKCSHCNKPWTQEEKIESIARGELVLDFDRQSNTFGMNISQLYSPTVTAFEIVDEFLKARSDQIVFAEWMNSVCGRPYIMPGAQLDSTIIEACIGSIAFQHLSASAIMGVDVTPDGQHYAVIAEVINYQMRIVALARPTWDELPVLMQQYNVRLCVIDCEPEVTQAREFCEAFQGRALRADYPSMGIKELYLPYFPLDNNPSNMIKLDRTGSIDKIMKGLKMKGLLLANNLPYFKDFVEHICSLVRIYKKNRAGIAVPRYVEQQNKPDHFAHALNYCNIASILSPFTMGPSHQEIKLPRQDGTFRL